MTTLSEKILAINKTLDVAGYEHAFGGALALAFHVAEPRGTRDIDVNIFVPATRANDAFRALPESVAWDAKDVDLATHDGQIRLFWDDTPIDIFFSTDRFHDETALATLDVPFAGTDIPILGATELVVFKACFNRTKDWADIEAIVEVGAMDAHRALGWLVDLAGEDDPRIARLRSLLPRA